MFKDSLGKLTQRQELNQEELREFVEGMGDDSVTETQVAGFLVALVMKGPTTDEVASIARVMRENAIKIEPKVSGNLTDTCGTGGGLRTFNVSSANAILTAAAGVPVAKHGSRSISATSGSADALEALGIVAEVTPEQAKQLIEQVGISFLYAPTFHPIMMKVFFPELALGIKTIFFTIIGPLINPAGARHHMLGVYQPEFVDLVSNAAAQLDMGHVVVAHGVDGLDEVSLLGATQIADVKGSKVERYEVTPEDFGLKRASFEDLQGGDPAFNGGVIRGIFEGRDTGPRRDFLILNNAFTLYAADKVARPEDGIALARENIESGAAQRKLEEFAAASQRFAKPAA
jgi:anthranilate phosphoribosyltransferase